MNLAGRAALVALVIAAAACGKKGDPLPPLNRLPVAPDAFVATRRADAVEIAFTTPATNSDGTRPANIERIDIYAYTGPAATPDGDVLRLGSRIATVDVKFPRNPNRVVQPGDDDVEAEPLMGSGLDQGVATRVREDLTPSMVATAADGSMRHYIGVGITTRGRNGLLSKRVAVPLRSAPAVPGLLNLTYDERAVTLRWRAAPAADPEHVLSYNIYEVPLGSPDETRINPAPVEGTELVDPRIVWGAERCYAVRAVDSRDGLTVEGDAGVTSCITLVDRFAPSSPAGLVAVGSDGAVSLTWDPNTESDLAGYRVMRGVEGATYEAVTPAPIPETNYRDSVASGVRYGYQIVAVDKSGNLSQPSAVVYATAR